MPSCGRPPAAGPVAEVGKPAASMRYVLPSRVAARLVSDPAVTPELSAAVVTNSTTRGLRMIDGRSVRCSFQPQVPHTLSRGLFACRCVVNQQVVATGLCCVDETLDKCELMAFPLDGGEVLQELEQSLPVSLLNISHVMGKVQSDTCAKKSEALWKHVNKNYQLLNMQVV